jgi:hypothetical protein
MWLHIPASGWFSIVASADDDQVLVVRARVRDDLKRLQSHIRLGPIKAHAGTDYAYRCDATRDAVAEGLADLAANLDYTNVKSETLRVLGSNREASMHRVWALLLTELRDDAAGRNLPDVDADVPAAARKIRRRRRPRS